VFSKSQNLKISKSQNLKISKSQNLKISKSQNLKSIMPIQIRFPAALLMLAIALPLCFANLALAQDDAVYRLRESGTGTTKIRGKITGTTPFSVLIQSDAGPQEIPVAEIDKIEYLNQPLGLSRGEDRVNDGRYEDALEEFGKLTPQERENPQLKPEIEFWTATANAELALAGNGAAAEAGRAVFSFLQANPSSHHFYPATETLGKLLLATGKLEPAAAEFAKLAQSKWPALILRGHFFHGRTLIAMGKASEAETAFKAILATASNDDTSQTYKRLAEVELAKVAAMSGNTDAAIKTLQGIIKAENPDNATLFAFTYNALGVAQLKAGKIKEARNAFLHTHLLYPNEDEPHAEALYHLTSIWTELKNTDRAAQTREALKSSYRNSYWATKL